jgi:integrase
MIEARLSQSNGRLKAAKVGVSIIQQGDRLYLRATFPPKPGSDRIRSFQQRLALGVHANPAGLSFAEKEARKVGALLDCKQFDWTPYLKPAMPDPETVNEWVQRFEADYFSRRARSHKTETTWQGDYQKVFRRLPQDQALSVALLKQAILETPPDSKTRKRACMVLGAIARFANLEFDPKPFAGSYSPRRVSPRDLPTDEVIAEQYATLTNPGWQWVYGMIATYGLRPHEVFRLDLDELKKGQKIVSVLDGKTCSRRVWPCYPEWYEGWSLSVVTLPNIMLNRANDAVGESCAHYFKGKLPFKLYDLRHCWAVRTLEFGLDVTLAAQQMGHSVQVHTEQYHAWITDRHHQRAFEQMMMRPDRPVAPLTVTL